MPGSFASYQQFDGPKRPKVRLLVVVGWRLGDDTGPQGPTQRPTYYEEYDAVSGLATNSYHRSSRKGYWRASGKIEHVGNLEDAIRERLQNRVDLIPAVKPDHDYVPTPRGNLKIEGETP